MPTRILLPLLLLASALLTPVAVGHAADPLSAREDVRPNIVLIMTDDMAASDLRWMPRTERLLGRQGLTFDQALAPNPMCCPARATVLTGQESHNNDVWSNTGARGGYGALTAGPRLPDWLQDAGYRTAFLGKHLNGFHADDAAAESGWDVLDALVRGVYSYRSFTTWDNGGLDRVRDGYVTDHLTERATGVIRRFDRDDRDPFFTWISHVGPHKASVPGCGGSGCWQPPVPAARDLGDFSGVRSPSRDLPSWNLSSDQSRPPFLRDLDRVDRRYVDTLFQRRVEALQSVDRSVAATVRALRDHGELGRTLLVFTSDNGFMLGQYRHLGKRLPYEESIRVPLLVRGPGVQTDSRTDQTATAADLTRTIVGVAGAKPTHDLDGVSLVPVFAGGSSGRSATILQSGAAIDPEGDGVLEGADDHGWLYRGYRDARWTYALYPDPAGPETPAFEELYDRRADPHELHNLAGDSAYAHVLAQARHRAALLEACAGESCHPAWEPIPGGD